ncbi:hypothetical protein [Pseudoalteromonas profundi]|uniref:Uncharacterized protein n=1 Tax=Pseudoalteromonas gelatinilytica TaxID=1703256 RepID=A0A3A3EGD5_9GAMM|nr:hypothetical protein [Pseudoalteromonas profundi]RJF34367.1 hypothetical protein D4741_13330 [Pseudoalteromonas profundi]|tara:strand:+ start:1646 stop:2182 length:537 start_codon:yes stop_codon:yes gene_type:complete
MSDSSRKLKIKLEISENFKQIADILRIAHAHWAGFLVQHELDFFKRNYYQLRPNSPMVAAWFKQQRDTLEQEGVIQPYSIRMPQSLVDDLTGWCKQYRVSKDVFVEYALGSFIHRVDVGKAKYKKLKRHEVMPLYLLEHSFRARLTETEKISFIREKILIQEHMLPGEFRKAFNESKK